MGTPPRQNDGHAFIIELKFCHVKRFMLVLVKCGKKPGQPQPGDRLLQNAVVGSDYHFYQVLGDTGIGLGDDGDPRMLRREFGSATGRHFFAVFFFIFSLDAARQMHSAVC